MNKNQKPVIGVIPLYDEARESIWMVPGYLDGLRAAGAVPVILPLHLERDEFAVLKAEIQGFLFTGGQDVSPKLYKESKTAVCGEPCEARDRLEQMIFSYAYEKDIPLLGICRGIQMINVLMGGSLYQDLPSQYHGTSPVEHHMTAPYDRPVHRVDLVDGTPLGDLLGKPDIGVNSYHHQGIKAMALGLHTMAYAEDGLTEGIYAPDKSFLWGVQWHPEFSYRKDENQQKIFKAFVNAAGSKV